MKTEAPAEPSPIRSERVSGFGLQDEVYFFCGLMLLTCLFLPWRGEPGSEVTVWGRFSSADSLFTGVPWLLLFGLLAASLACVRLPRARPWLGLATAIGFLFALFTVNILPASDAYGATWTRLFALGLLVSSAGSQVGALGDLAMRRLNARRAEVFSHWGTVLESAQFSARRFYEGLEAEIRERQWPGVECLRILHTEAGLLSHRREYLRVIRQRQVFDVCASTFGRDYFFSLREAEIPAGFTPVTLLIALLSIAMLAGLCLSLLGFLVGLIFLGCLILGGAFLLFNTLRMGLTRLDGLLLRTPVLGVIYETWFRRSTTYFQHDSRVVFLKLMDDLVKRHVAVETSSEGVKHLPCFEHQPILDGLYKSTVRPVERGP